MTDTLTYKLAFASIRGMNPRLGAELLRLLGSEQAFFEASETQLRYLTQSKAAIYTDDYRREVLDKAAAETAFIADNNIRPLYFTDTDYPHRLTDCDDAPAMLYTLGECNLNSARMLGIVGTRHATPYGISFTEKLVEQLAQSVDGLVIVSGLAYGIDIAAHRAAMRCGIPTIAVLAHGLDTLYPAAHRREAAEIARHGGALVTEYRHGTRPIAPYFLARNRIVAGLCDCIVVAESAIKGGALVTARIASGYGREVFALPGRTSDVYSAGCNRLIATNTAALLDSPGALAQAMQWPVNDSEAEQPTLPMPLTDGEQQLINYLTANESATINRISVDLDIPIARLMSLLIDLEFRGVIASVPGGRYQVL